MIGLNNIWSFYCYIEITSPSTLIPKLLLICKKKSIKGTILLSTEGFNASISGEYKNVQLVFNELANLTYAQDINLKIHSCSENPFSKLKIKVKKEIVRFGIENLDVKSFKGLYVEPNNWEELARDDQTLLIDVRNDYEVQMGSFKNSINPKIETFRQFAVWSKNNLSKFKNKKVAMFCTGGIRCEKSSAYLKLLGHSSVYQLRGGILQYFQYQKSLPVKKNSLWRGKCFVFDNRKSLNISSSD